jgi:hypothetical protein
MGRDFRNPAERIDKLKRLALYYVAGADFQRGKETS